MKKKKQVKKQKQVTEAIGEAIGIMVVTIAALTVVILGYKWISWLLSIL